jgi:hypothetical protein
MLGWVKISKNKPNKDETENCLKNCLKKLCTAQVLVSILLIGAMVATNAFYFRAWAKSEVSANKWVDIKGAFNNETFKTINISLFVPFVTVLVNSVFKVDAAVKEATVNIRENRLRMRINSIEKYNRLNPDDRIEEDILEKIKVKLENIR